MAATKDVNKKVSPAPVPQVPVQDLAVSEGKATDSPHLSVVIPYYKAMAQGNELLFAIRSWYTFARFPFHLFVIGDPEDWMDGENVTWIDCPRVSDIPSVDTLHKLHEILTYTAVTEQFIWTNDDIYLMNPVSYPHIALPKVLGTLNPAAYNGHYRAAMERTVEMLTEAGLPLLNYGTHTPVVFTKSKLKAVLPADDPKAETGVLFTSLYFNTVNTAHPARLDWKTDPFLLPVVSKAPDEKYVNELLRNKVFLNNANSGYSPWLESFLARRFPEKCPAEL